MCNILVSACLLGVNCRYNGEVKENKRVMELLQRKGVHLIPVCPEQMGGLATPRDPSEIQSDGCVLTKNGRDVTAEYRRGAGEALKIAGLYQCDMAILKERSPSCGYGRIYDGTFSGTLTDGDGITAGLLIRHGIDVFGESELDQLITLLEEDYLGQEDEEDLPFTDIDDLLLFGETVPYQNKADPTRVQKAGKNHIRMNGQVYQTNKRYSDLKERQKEKIAHWMRHAIERFYAENGRYPGKEDGHIVVDDVYQKITQADIWIPYDEIEKQYQSRKSKIISKLLAKSETK